MSPKRTGFLWPGLASGDVTGGAWGWAMAGLPRRWERKDRLELGCGRWSWEGKWRHLPKYEVLFYNGWSPAERTRQQQRRERHLAKPHHRTKGKTQHGALSEMPTRQSRVANVLCPRDLIELLTNNSGGTEQIHIYTQVHAMAFAHEIINTSAGSGSEGW
jgi:hypothetical protein